MSNAAHRSKKMNPEMWPLDLVQRPWLNKSIFSEMKSNKGLTGKESRNVGRRKCEQKCGQFPPGVFFKKTFQLYKYLVYYP